MDVEMIGNCLDRLTRCSLCATLGLLRTNRRTLKTGFVVSVLTKLNFESLKIITKDDPFFFRENIDLFYFDQCSAFFFFYLSRSVQTQGLQEVQVDPDK